MSPAGKSHDLPAERLTISLPFSLAARLRLEARAGGTSVSAVVRAAAEEHLARRAPLPAPSFIGIASSGETDLSERVEEIIAEHIDRHGRL